MTRIDSIVETDGALVLGAGIAGLFTALKLAPMPSVVLAGTRPGLSGSSAWAQGGIAAAVGENDSWQSHAADTIAAGAGLCDRTIVELVAREAPDRIQDLIAFGAPFDRKSDGSLALGREAAHSLPRIVHVKGDGAGAAISATLAARAHESNAITLLEGFHAVELAMEGGRVTGIFARAGLGPDARLILFRARAVVLATGGLGALYAVTTNPLEARGEGLGMAARAGAMIADPEFVQFHPTAIAVGRDPAPLATEALRGEGAVLVNGRGERFRHPQGCRVGAARYRGARHPSSDRFGSAGVSGLPRSDRRQFRQPFSHRVRGLPGGRHRSGDATDPGRAGGALSHGRHCVG